jgi:hypothetical protein
MMKHIYIMVEGQTEEMFVKELINPFLESYERYAIPILLGKRKDRSRKHFGGIIDYEPFLRETRNLLYGSESSSLVTTMIDLYGLKSSFPQKTVPFRDPYQKVTAIENAMANAINHPRFLPYVQLHEFEALLFSDIAGWQYCYKSAEILGPILQIINTNNNPELINEGPATAPSKRIEQVIPDFSKIINGNTVALENGLESMRQRCPHFAEWLNAIATR